MPATLSMFGDVWIACCAPIDTRNGSSPATVRSNWPSSWPLALIDRLPLPTAIVSPCAMRAWVMSMRPPLAWSSRKRAGQGLGEKSPRPRSTPMIVGVDRLHRRRIEGRRRGLRQPQHHLDHRIVGGGAFGDAAVHFDALGAQQVGLAAVVDAVDHRLVEHQPRRARASAGVPRTLDWPSFQLATILGAWPRSAMVSGPGIR